MTGAAAGPVRAFTFSALLCTCCTALHAGELDEITVTATRERTVSGAAASAGTVTAEELESRPLLRPAQVLESVPGLVVTQHSGDGKANQYFLRGFNLDHGTDFATSVDGVPVNMPTNAHGQGYSDLNFLIPELIESIEYRKGVYYAQEGDFSAAGAAHIHYRSRLDEPFVTASAGEGGYRRFLAATSAVFGGSQLLFAGEYGLINGPWVPAEDFHHASGLIKLTGGDERVGYSLAAMGYDARWRATDQIPQRAVDLGLISRFGSIDPTDGGRSHRWNVSIETAGRLDAGRWHAQAYLLDYQLDLFSNFTYFTDPLHGDQFEQYDNRHVYGATLELSVPLELFGEQAMVSSGVQLRQDRVDPVGLYDTTGRTRWKTVSVTTATVRTAGAYLAWQLQPASWWRVQLGARVDSYQFDVSANLPANSGSARAALGSPKLTLAFGPWGGTECFLDFGQGFHSNDARGTTLTVDPGDGMRVSKVTALARATGAELGLRSRVDPALELTAALWGLHLDSELVLDNDASAIVPSAATRRYGVELASVWRPWDFLRLGLDLASTRARFIDASRSGQYLPNAPTKVASLDAALDRPRGWFGGAHARYFGATALTQDGTVRSRPSLQVDAEAGYHFGPALSGTVAVFNLLDRHDRDIEYYYASQLRGEPAPVYDLHFHPLEPRTLRATLSYRF